MMGAKKIDILRQVKTEEVINLQNTKGSDFWIVKGRERAVALFKMVAYRVPAYKDFLRKHRINPSKVKKWGDFLQVPIIDKNNYLRKYPLEKLCWDGNLKKTLVFTSTSGSTGVSVYFPRNNEIDWQYSVILESFLRENKKDASGPILIIDCFGMGVWIGGLITYQAFLLAVLRSNLSVSIITPGVNKVEIFNILKNLAPQFKQVILTGYPPFIKDIIDEARQEKIDLKRMNIRLLFAAEAVTERLRDYLGKKISIRNIFLDTLNIYGSADMGAMAFETKISILIKRLAAQNKLFFNDLFSQTIKTPTLAQFNPLFINFEAVNSSIVLTGDNALPLVRYSIGDHGGVFGFSEMMSICKKYDINFQTETQKHGIKNIAKLPFVYIYERSDFSTTLYGLQIYPEMIKEVVIGGRFGCQLTGKFTLITKFNVKNDQYLEINLELIKGKSRPNRLFTKQLLKRIIDNLRRKSSEFRELTNHLNRCLIDLVFWPAESTPYFKPGIKQKWVKK